MALAKLADIPEETWGNAILYRLALELGYEPDEVSRAERVITADPDALLDEALQFIHYHREGCYT